MTTSDRTSEPTPGDDELSTKSAAPLVDGLDRVEDPRHFDI
ncbi:MAG: hypothetical protein V9E94_14925 [Microthrixaceae bacterium]